MGRIGKSVDGIYHDRIIDIDLLICLDISGREVLMDTPQLKLPHPLIHLRDFVMKPLKEIAPELTYSILSKQKANEKIGLFILLLWVILCIKAQEKNEFTVLQWNIWQEGTQVKGGYDAIVDEIVRLKPDFVTLSEVRNYKNTRFCDRIVQSLKQRGEIYYSFSVMIRDC